MKCFLFTFPSSTFFLGLFFLSFFFLKFNPAGLTFGFWYTEGPGEETGTPVKADAFLYLGSAAGG